MITNDILNILDWSSNEMNKFRNDIARTFISLTEESIEFNGDFWEMWIKLWEERDMNFISYLKSIENCQLTEARELYFSQNDPNKLKNKYKDISKLLPKREKNN